MTTDVRSPKTDITIPSSLRPLYDAWWSKMEVVRRALAAALRATENDTRILEAQQGRLACAEARLLWEDFIRSFVDAPTELLAVGQIMTREDDVLAALEKGNITPLSPGGDA